MGTITIWVPPHPALLSHDLLLPSTYLPQPWVPWSCFQRMPGPGYKNRVANIFLSKLLLTRDCQEGSVPTPRPPHQYLGQHEACPMPLWLWGLLSRIEPKTTMVACSVPTCSTLLASLPTLHMEFLRSPPSLPAHDRLKTSRLRRCKIFVERCSA